MFCTNCGKKIEAGMLFCTECGAPLSNENSNDTVDVQGGSSNAGQQRGVWVEQDFEKSQQDMEKAEKNTIIWKIIWTVVILVFLYWLVRSLLGDTEDILSGKSSWLVYLKSISLWGFPASFTFYFLSMVRMLHVFLKGPVGVTAETYLNLIRVDDTQKFMRILSRLQCASVKNVYWDEKDDICIQGKWSKYIITITDQIPVMTSLKNNKSLLGISGIFSLKNNLEVISEQESIAKSLLNEIEPEVFISADKNERTLYRLSTVRTVSMIFTVTFIVAFLWLNAHPGMLEGRQKYVRFMKEASPVAYPDITYGDAFEEFFSNCKWEYFKSTEGQNVVEFTGNCMYDNENATVLIQFLIYYDEGRAKFHTMLINDEPQTNLVWSVLIEKVFNDFDSGADSNALMLEQEQEDTETSAAEETGDFFENLVNTEETEDSFEPQEKDFNDENLYIGEWEASKASVTVDGEVREMNASDIYQNFTMFLMSGGKATVNLNGEESESRWKIVDNGIEIDGELIIKKEGSSLVVEQDGTKIYFEKKDFNDTSLNDENDYSFNIWDLAGGYEGEDLDVSTDISISIYSSPSGNNVGNFKVTFTDYGTKYTGQLYRDSDKTFTLVSDDDGSTAYIEVVDETPGRVVVHYYEEDFDCNFCMYEAYPMP